MDNVNYNGFNIFIFKATLAALVLLANLLGIIVGLFVFWLFIKIL